MLAPFLAALFLAAPAPTPVVALVPLAAPADLQELAYAVSLRLQEGLERTPLFVMHQKQIYVVADATRVSEDKFATLADVKRIGERLGATHLLFGELRHNDKVIELVLSLTIGGAAPSRKLLTVPSGEAPTIVDGAPGLLVEVIGGVLDSAAINLVKATPAFSARAYKDYAACHKALTRQAVSLRTPVLLDADSRVAAVQKCTQATKAAPQMKQAFAALAFARALVGEREEAEAALASAKGEGLIPYYAVAKFWVLSRFYDPQSAVAFLKEATQQAPGFLLGRGYLGEALNATKRYDEALEVFTAYAQDVPKQPWARAQIGYTQAKRGEVAKAIDETKSALDLTPDDQELKLELASRFIDAQRYLEAQRMLDAQARDPNVRGEVLLRLSYAHLMQDHLAEAEKWSKLALERATSAREWRTRGRARYDLARIAAKKGNKAAALDELERAFAEGYKDAAKLANEKDFDTIRTEPRFTALGSKPKPAQIKLPLFTSPFAHDPLTGGEAPLASKDSPLQKKAVEVRF